MSKLVFNALSGEVVNNKQPEFSMFKSLGDFAPHTIQLEEFISMVSHCKYGAQIDRVREATSKENKAQAKKSLPAVTFSGVFSGGRKREQLIHHSGLICLDFDLEENPCLSTKYDEIKAAIALDVFSLLTFKSAGGDGLAVVCRIDPDCHLQAFLALAQYYLNEYGLTADKACKDISRLRFVSCDPDLGHNENARIFKRYSLVPEETQDVLPQQPQKSPTTPSEASEPITAPVSSSITPTRAQEILSALGSLSPDNYDDWIQAGQAIHSEDSTTKGFEIWDTWSQLNDKQGKYDSEATRKKWTGFSKGRGLNIETLFKLAYKNGWDGPGAVDNPIQIKDPLNIPTSEAIEDSMILPTIRGDEWNEAEEAQREPIIEDLIDRGDMLEINAPSKMRKSFFALNLGLCAATAKPFLKWAMAEKQTVLYFNFEVKADWQHRRQKAMAKALGFNSEDLAKIHFCNTRGLETKNMINAVRATVRAIKPTLIIVDPLYMLHDGDENHAQDMKPLVRSFGALMSESGAALVTVHHDPKGTAGDRNIRDRGAGSGIWSRAVDARLTLTRHAENPDFVCIDTMARNFKDVEGFVCSFDGAFHLEDAEEYNPETSKTSKKKKEKKTIEISEVASQSMYNFEDHDWRTTEFRQEVLQEMLGLGIHKAKEVIKHLLEQDMVCRSKQYQKGYWIGTADQIRDRNAWIEKNRGVK